MSIEQRQALLTKGYGHGQAIAQLAKVGTKYTALASYVAAASDLNELNDTCGKRIIFAERVIWQITLDAADNILGFSQSGFDPLMEELGIDFSGAAYRGSD